jgi:hypothetical protein
MRFKQEIKDRLYGGHIGIETDKIDFEILKVMLADDKKKVEGLEWPFGAVSAVIAVAPDGAVVALKEEHAESYELVKYQDAVEEDMQPINADVNEVAEMPSLSVVKVIPAQIEGCNVKHFKEAVKSYLKRYDGIVVAADNYKELSDVVSKLKKEKDNVNESKKAVKKEAMKVYTDFENDMKEVLKMFDASISSLSSDIKEFTDKEVEENKKVVEALCKKALHDYVERNDFNEYFAANFFNTNPRWNTLKKFINNHKPTKALVEEIKQECERVKKEYEIYQQKIEGLCIYLEAKCKETDIDQQMFDLTLYKKMLIQESLESLTKDIDCRINGILRNRELQKQKEEEAKKKEVKQQEPVNASPEENEPLKMLVGKIVGTNSALNELKTSLDYLKAKYDGCFDYDLRFPRKKEGK